MRKRILPGLEGGVRMGRCCFLQLGREAQVLVMGGVIWRVRARFLRPIVEHPIVCGDILVRLVAILHRCLCVVELGVYCVIDSVIFELLLLSFVL